MLIEIFLRSACVVLLLRFLQQGPFTYRSSSFSVHAYVYSWLKRLISAFQVLSEYHVHFVSGKESSRLIHRPSNVDRNVHNNCTYTTTYYYSHSCSGPPDVDRDAHTVCTCRIATPILAARSVFVSLSFVSCPWLWVFEGSTFTFRFAMLFWLSCALPKRKRILLTNT